ncbi:MAG TPA: glycoside hydrolase family 76 protein, partial [Ktedonobacteraceae bacterium]|nr:glycoside hydrolase family 76 protein [Ktedonobacteraceae bacterium]
MNMQRLQTRILSIVVLICTLSMSFLLTTQTASAATNYRADADASAAALQGWYNSSNGLFNNVGWWNSANALGALIDYSALTRTSTYTNDISTTYAQNASGKFLNNYYDDEGWWALTWVKAYDLTGNTTYLNAAKTIFSDMAGGWDNTCNGGVWWSKSKTYKNAIPNELFLALAAKLHQRTPGDSGTGSYLDWANKEWSWFSASGMINSSNLINDGLTSSCQNNGQTTWTYNQGVILGGLTDLSKMSGNTTYLSKAESIANAAITTLIDPNGVLQEPCEPANTCNGDSAQFKGILMRNLIYLYQSGNNATDATFLQHNADSLWNNDRNSSNQLGLRWSGPFDSADATRQSSAQDALNAALSFTDSQGANVALEKSATANSSCTSTETPNKAVDGSVTNDSKWCGGSTNGKYWLKIDLGMQYPINNFIIQHAGAGGESTSYNTRDFNIQLSSDNTNWTTVVSV